MIPVFSGGLLFLVGVFFSDSAWCTSYITFVGTLSNHTVHAPCACGDHRRHTSRSHHSQVRAPSNHLSSLGRMLEEPRTLLADPRWK